MRYVAKVHIFDVMDNIAVSGYVYDADDTSDPDHQLLEFGYTVKGMGVSEPHAWLLNSLYRALVSKENTP